MICSECVHGDHGGCRTNERWGQPSRTGLSPVSRDLQKRTWCYCQHRGWPPKESPTIKAEVTETGGSLTVKPYGIPALPSETRV